VSATKNREGESIDITRYAEVMAHIRHFPADRHLEVVARLGIRRRDWQAAAAKWQRVRDAERLTGKLEVTVRYGRVLKDTRARLEAEQPPLESLGPYPGPDGAPGEAAARAAPSARPVPEAHEAPLAAEPSVRLPSYLAAESHAAAQITDPPPVSPPPARRAPSALASTALGAAPPTAPVVPFVAPSGSSEESFARAVAHAEQVQGPAEAPRSAAGSGTVAVSEDVAGPPLPPGVPDLTLQQYASLRVELEISSDDKQATLARYGISADARVALDAHWRHRFSVDPPLRMLFAGTYARYLAWLRGSKRGAPIAPPPATPITPPPTPREDAPARPVGPPDAVGSGTVALSNEAAPPPLPPGVPDLTPAQYASLRVELETSPERMPATLARYGLPADGREALDAHWKARFAADPALRMTFAHTYAEYDAWFKGNRNPSQG